MSGPAKPARGTDARAPARSPVVFLKGILSSSSAVEKDIGDTQLYNVITPCAIPLCGVVVFDIGNTDVVAKVDAYGAHRDLVPYTKDPGQFRGIVCRLCIRAIAVDAGPGAEEKADLGTCFKIGSGTMGPFEEN